MDLRAIYEGCGALLRGHFLLSSGRHSEFYLQSAKVLEDPRLAGELANELKKIILAAGLKFDSVASPALGGILAGYELARALGKRFIFTERVAGEMTLRRGFGVGAGESFLICEDIITTGGSALECAKVITELGGRVVGFAALANRGRCGVTNLATSPQPDAKLPSNLPLFALGNFDFELYEPGACPLCAASSTPVKPGSRPTK